MMFMVVGSGGGRGNNDNSKGGGGGVKTKVLAVVTVVRVEMDMTEAMVLAVVVGAGCGGENGPLLVGARVKAVVAMVLLEVGGAVWACSFNCFPQLGCPLRGPYLSVTMCLYLSETFLPRGL